MPQTKFEQTVELPQSLTIIMKDGRKFEITPAYVKTPDGPRCAARLWLDGVIIEAVTADTYEEAMDKAFEMMKARR